MGLPVEGAELSVFDEFQGVSGADGSFSIPDVPTIRGPIAVSATATVGPATLRGDSVEVPPVRGGTTDVGVIVVVEKPDAVLVFGDRVGDRAGLVTELTALGLPVTNVAALPDDLTPFGTIWHVSAFTALTPAEQTRLADYVNSGRGLHLTGERPCCDTLNDSIETLVNSLVAGGGISVGRLGDVNGPYAFHPGAQGGVTTVPNPLGGFIASASGGMAGFGLPDPRVLATGAGARVVGGVWDCGNMTSGAGRVTVLMDVNWFSNIQNRPQTVENIQEYLGAAPSAAACGL